MTVHSNLKALVDARGFSIRQVAREADCHFDTVRIMYNDEMERYPRELLYKLATYLDVPINELLIIKNTKPVD